MTFYKHYSFDLWMTLIKSNPSFKKERAAFFYKHFNSKKKSQEEASLIFRHVDLMCNSINEKTGESLGANEMHLMVISMMNDFNTSFDAINLAWLYNEMEKLLFNYMPEVYCGDTINVLDRIKQGNNNSLNISSNTAFIKGATLRKVLSELSLSPYFDFQLYSDEIGVSKPDRRFFELLIDSINEFIPNNKISLEEIVHVGDNPNADISGALAAGIHGIQINSNDKNILSLIS